jgi:transcriptional regulator with XRE-family HTH domain
LNELLWQRVAEMLNEQGIKHVDLWRRLGGNKNTHTSWMNGRTVPNLSDLEELAEILRVPAADLLRPVEDGRTPKRAEKLELPFSPGSKGAQLEVQYTPLGLILRPLGRPA